MLRISKVPPDDLRVLPYHSVVGGVEEVDDVEGEGAFGGDAPPAGPARRPWRLPSATKQMI